MQLYDRTWWFYEWRRFWQHRKAAWTYWLSTQQCCCCFFYYCMLRYERICVRKTSCARIQLCDKGMKITNYKANIKRKWKALEDCFEPFFNFIFPHIVRWRQWWRAVAAAFILVTQPIFTYYSPSAPKVVQMFISVWNIYHSGK